MNGNDVDNVVNETSLSTLLGPTQHGPRPRSLLPSPADLVDAYDLMTSILAESKHDRLHSVTFHAAWAELVSFLPVLQRWASLTRPGLPMHASSLHEWRHTVESPVVAHPLSWWGLFLTLLFQPESPCLTRTYRILVDTRLDLLIELSAFREHMPWVDTVLAHHTRQLISVYWLSKRRLVDSTRFRRRRRQGGLPPFPFTSEQLLVYVFPHGPPVDGIASGSLYSWSRTQLMTHWM